MEEPNLHDPCLEGSRRDILEDKGDNVGNDNVRDGDEANDDDEEEDVKTYDHSVTVPESVNDVNMKLVRATGHGHTGGAKTRKSYENSFKLEVRGWHIESCEKFIDGWFLWS
jgi:hypothetical protein